MPSLFLSYFFGLSVILLNSCGDKQAPDSSPGEIITGPGEVIDTAAPITMDQFIGVNAFVDDPPQLI